MLLTLFCLAIGCGKKVSNRPVDMPILPAPEAELYAIGKSQPKDVLVYKVSSGLPWDEALSGAAASVGLNAHKSPSLSTARWAAVVSGYPYGVRELVIGREEIGKFPEGLAERLQRRLGKGEHVGIARVRNVKQDIWVALIGVGGPRVSPFPRKLETGARFEFDIYGVKWRLLSPDGHLIQGDGKLSKLLSIEGEWWLELSKGGKIFSSVPIHVGIETPPTNLFSDAAKDSTVDGAISLINKMRKAETLPKIDNDDILQTLSVKPLSVLENGKWSVGYGQSMLQKSGLVEGRYYQFACQVQNVGECLDSISWKIDGRDALLSPEIQSIGMSIRRNATGINMIVNLSGG